MDPDIMVCVCCLLSFSCLFSQFRGVAWDQKAAHWRVEVRAPGGETRINCGTWDDEADAGRAYDREAKVSPSSCQRHVSCLNGNGCQIRCHKTSTLDR